MKKIKIYLVANEKIVEQDKKELEEFIQELNKKYNKGYEIYFDLINDENLNNLNEEEIKNSELFYILFCNEIDKQSVDKFNVAYDSFMQKLTPKITTYIKNSNEPASKSVNEFLKKIDTELGHYHSVYNNVDTIKLNLILKLQNLELQLGDLKTEDGKLFIGNQEIMSIENIPMILNNNDLRALKTELQELEEKYWKLRDEIRKSEASESAQEESIDTSKTDEILEEYRKVIARRKKAKEDIFELEKNIIELENSFVKMSENGKLSQKQLYAKKCLDEGKVQEAKEALDFDEIKAEADKILQFKESKKDELRININELIQRVDTLKLDITNESRFAEIEKTFEEAIRIEKEGGLYRGTLIEYSNYLFYQNKFQKSVEYAEIFEKYSNVYDVEKYDKAKIYNLLAINYENINQYDKAEKYNKEAIRIYEELTEENPEWYKGDLARSYYNFAGFYEEKENYDKSEEYYIKAIKMQEEMLDLNKELYSLDLASSYNNLAYMYLKKNQYEYSENFLKKAIEISEEFVGTYDVYNEILATSYNNIAMLYSDINQYNKADEYYQKALKIDEKLAKENPESNLDTLANLYNNMAAQNYENNKYSVAEEYYLKSIEIYEEIVKAVPEAFDERLALSYWNLSVLYSEYSDMKAWKKAEKYHKKSIYIYERLAEKNHNVYIGSLARAYSGGQTIMVYIKNKHFEIAESYCKKAIEIYQELVKNNPDEYKNLLGDAYNNIALVYSDTLTKRSKAEEKYKKAIEIYENIVKENEELYTNTLALIYRNLADLYSKTKKLESAEKYYKKSIEITEKLAKINPSVYNGELAIEYVNIFDMYCRNKKYNDAREYGIKSIKLNNELAKTAPEKYNANLANSYLGAGFIISITGGRKEHKKSAEYINRSEELYAKISKINSKESMLSLWVCKLYKILISMNVIKAMLLTIVLLVLIFSTYLNIVKYRLDVIKVCNVILVLEIIWLAVRGVAKVRSRWIIRIAICVIGFIMLFKCRYVLSTIFIIIDTLLLAATAGIWSLVYKNKKEIKNGKI